MRLPLRSVNVLTLGSYPELRGGNLDIVDQERAASAKCQVVRDHAACRDHVNLTDRQRLEDFRPGIELRQLEVDPIPLERAAIETGPYLPVDGNDVEKAEPKPCLRMDNCWCCDRHRETRRADQELPSVHRSISRRPFRAIFNTGMFPAISPMGLSREDARHDIARRHLQDIH
jgi:hypothetical protein